MRKFFEKLKNVILSFFKKSKVCNKNQFKNQVEEDINVEKAIEEQEQLIRVYDAISGDRIFLSTLDRLKEECDNTKVQFNVIEGQQDISIKVTAENIDNIKISYRALYDDGREETGTNMPNTDELWFGVPVVSEENCYIVDLDLYFEINNEHYHLECGDIIYEYDVYDRVLPIDGFSLFIDPDHYECVETNEVISRSFYTTNRDFISEKAADSLWPIMFPEDGHYMWKTYIDNDVIDEGDFSCIEDARIPYNNLITRVAIYRIDAEHYDAIYIKFV